LGKRRLRNDVTILVLYYQGGRIIRCAKRILFLSIEVADINSQVTKNR